MLYTPPPSLKASNQLAISSTRKVENIYSRTILALLLSSFFIPLAYSESLIIENNPSASNLKTFNDGSVHEYDSLYATHTPYIEWNQHTIRVNNKTTLNINGTTSIYLSATEFKESNNEGNYALSVEGTGTEVNLRGDVDIFVYQKDDTVDLSSIGANGIWASSNATVNIGSENHLTKIWTFAQKPDVLSAKNGATINILSEKNQIVGNLDTGGFLTSREGTITGTFSGADSFWVGNPGTLSLGTIDFTFRDSAQWIYLNNKTIEQIRLEDGGIVNLYDQDIKDFFKETGLNNYLSDKILSYGHEYVQIYDLKGVGGIFKLDLNAEDKSKSDIVYIKDSSAPGKHYIDLVAHDLSLLESINPDNTLIFAITGKNASGEDGVSFIDKVNERGEGLIDYELQINSSEFTKDDADADEVKGPYYSYYGGTKWFIERITMHESAAALGMNGAGWAAYDAAVELDRHDRRLSEMVRDSDDANNGLWIRLHHGRSGAEHQYRWDRTGVTIGYDRSTSQVNRLGGWFSYSEGDTDFLEVRGSGDMKRYEIALFDTLTSGGHYLDFVGRLGRVSSDFSVGNETYKTTGDFEQDYFAVSAEYGYQLKDSSGVFVEPQAQIQYAYLDSYDYKSEREMSTKVDSANSLIGRIGFRAGRVFESSPDNFGEIYFRGDVLHQFTDGQDAVLCDFAGHHIDETWGDTGTWATFGIGAFWNWKNEFLLQLDAEKTSGGKTADTWLISGRFSYLF